MRLRTVPSDRHRREANVPVVESLRDQRGDVPLAVAQIRERIAGHVAVVAVGPFRRQFAEHLGAEYDLPPPSRPARRGATADTSCLMRYPRAPMAMASSI